MSLLDLDEIILENNIQLKEIELLRLIDQDDSSSIGQDAFDFDNSPPVDNSCICNLQASSNSAVAAQMFSGQIDQIQLNQMMLNIGNSNEYTDVMHYNALPIYCPNPVYNLNVDENIRGQANPDRSPSAAPNTVYAAKTVPTSIKRFKNNRKKNFPTKWSSQISIDYSKVVVNLPEIGLGCRRPKPIDKNRLILQFRRIYVYLTSLCKERMLLESIVFAKEQNVNRKYVQPANVSIARHFEYTLNIFSIEVKYVESILSTIQLRFDDTEFAKLYREYASKLVSAVNMLTIFFGSDILHDVNNSDVLRSVDDALTDVITPVRYMGALYTILAQKLLVKETIALQCRRKMFIGR